MMTFKDLQDEVKRRATMNEGGTQFNTAIKNIINSMTAYTAVNFKVVTLQSGDTEGDFSILLLILMSLEN